jgi:hypothetical protein
MKYHINPCEACWKKFKNGNCNINDLNNCIVDTATAFSHFPSNNTMSGNLSGQNWRECIREKMKTLPKQAGGQRDFCNFQLNVAPTFVQIPHFFPQFLTETGNKEKAFKLALEECKDCRYPNECKNTAQTDYDAVITKENLYIPNTENSTKDDDSTQPSGPTFEDVANQNPFVFWPFFIGWSIIFAIILTMFLKVLFSNISKK